MKETEKPVHLGTQRSQEAICLFGEVNMNEVYIILPFKLSRKNTMKKRFKPLRGVWGYVKEEFEAGFQD